MIMIRIEDVLGFDIVAVVLLLSVVVVSGIYLGTIGGIRYVYLLAYPAKRIQLIRKIASFYLNHNRVHSWLLSLIFEKKRSQPICTYSR